MFLQALWCCFRLKHLLSLSFTSRSSLFLTSSHALALLFFFLLFFGLVCLPQGSDLQRVPQLLACFLYFMCWCSCLSICLLHTCICFFFSPASLSNNVTLLLKRREGRRRGENGYTHAFPPPSLSQETKGGGRDGQQGLDIKHLGKVLHRV